MMRLVVALSVLAILPAVLSARSSPSSVGLLENKVPNKNHPSLATWLPGEDFVDATGVWKATTGLRSRSAGAKVTGRGAKKIPYYTEAGQRMAVRLDGSSSIELEGVADVPGNDFTIVAVVQYHEATGAQSMFHLEFDDGSVVEVEMVPSQSADASFALRTNTGTTSMKKLRAGGDEQPFNNGFQTVAVVGTGKKITLHIGGHTQESGHSVKARASSSAKLVKVRLHDASSPTPHTGLRRRPR